MTVTLGNQTYASASAAIAAYEAQEAASFQHAVGLAQSGQEFFPASIIAAGKAMGLALPTFTGATVAPPGGTSYVGGSGLAPAAYPSGTPIGYDGIGDSVIEPLYGSYSTNGYGNQASQVGFPLVAGGIVALRAALPWLLRYTGKLSLGFIIPLVKKFGALAVKTAIGVLAFNEMMDLFDAGAPDSAEVLIRRKTKGRRYSIGSNPRVKTLHKVARHTKRMLKRHDKLLREFFPKPRTIVPRPAGKYLSAVERKELTG